MNIPRLILVIFLTGILWTAVSQYFFCPRFTFQSPISFSGSDLYNPYDSISGDHWIKCNFHAHTNAWNGFTNGHGTAHDIYKAYHTLGYGIFCVSEYQKINTALKEITSFIPAYEHGYGIMKTHQTVLGNDKVCWLDYVFPQTLSNKQFILNKLSQNAGTAIIMNHPSLRNGYTFSDLKYLANYDGMEVLNPAVTSLAHWDSALTYGKKVFVVGNDDVHNILTKDRLATMCTWVNVPVVNEANVLAALKSGKSYGMIIGESKDALPALKRFTLRSDTITVEMHSEVSHISFIGQHGKAMKSFDSTSTAQYIFKPSDQYIRTEISYKDGSTIFLNPVFRYDKNSNPVAPPVVNISKTVAFMAIGFIIMAIWMRIVVLFILTTKTRVMLVRRFSIFSWFDKISDQINQKNIGQFLNLLSIRKQNKTGMQIKNNA